MHYHECCYEEPKQGRSCSTEDKIIKVGGLWLKLLLLYLTKTIFLHFMCIPVSRNQMIFLLPGEKKKQGTISSVQVLKGYEEVPWDNILPSKIQAPESTVEVMADPVSPYFTRKRYNSESELSQVVGGLWDRFQTRSFTSPQRPVVFVSPSSRTCHIPSYTGCVGAVNFEDVDNANVDLITLAHVRTSKPRYTNSAHTPNIPGYTGKVHGTATHPANSNLPSTTSSIIEQMHRYIAKHGHSTQHNHQGPLSQMLTPVSPQNSFKKIKQRTIKL